MAFHPQPKPAPRVKTRRTVSASADRAGSKEVKARSEGRCEVFEFSYPDVRLTLSAPWRCHRRASQVHHMIGGRGKRGIGISALAEHKQHVCEECHLDITGDVGGRKLLRVGGQVPHWTDRYQRVAKGRG